MKGKLLLVLVLMVGVVQGHVTHRTSYNGLGGNHLAPVRNYDSLSINNVSAVFQSDGWLFRHDTIAQSDTIIIRYDSVNLWVDSLYWTNYYNVAPTGYFAPKGTGLTTIFNAATWIGGIDGGGQLHVAAATYRQTGDDFWPGPAIVNGLPIDSIESNKWDRVWHITKNEVDIFRLNTFPVTSGSVPTSILQWPAKGNSNAVGNNGVALSVNQSEAPFVDADLDGLYDPAKGDYPEVLGDEMLWWVYNDVRPHGETASSPLNVEIHASAYAFSCPADSILSNTIFLKQQMINKGSILLDSVFVGSWIDMDIGCRYNDFMGCDTASSSFYGYNGNGIDTGCTSRGYGTQTPMQMVTMLHTPANNSGTQAGMSSYLNYNNDFNPKGNPENPSDYYNYLNGIWQDNTPITRDTCSGKGGNIPTKFMSPNSPADTLSFPSAWSACTCPYIPSDLRSIAASGPFSFHPGDSQMFEQAFIFHRFQSQTGCAAPFQAGDVQHIKDFYNHTLVGPCRYNTGINDVVTTNVNLTLYPNPATNIINYNITGLTNKATYSIIDITGRVLQVGEINGVVGSGTIDLKDFSKGIYVFRLATTTETMVRRIVVE